MAWQSEKFNLKIFEQTVTYANCDRELKEHREEPRTRPLCMYAQFTLCENFQT